MPELTEEQIKIIDRLGALILPSKEDEQQDSWGLFERQVEQRFDQQAMRRAVKQHTIKPRV